MNNISWLNLDRFDGYPDSGEKKSRPPTVLEKWQELGYDPVGENSFVKTPHPALRATFSSKGKAFDSADTAANAISCRGDCQPPLRF